jgi:hypothetical protein
MFRRVRTLIGIAGLALLASCAANTMQAVKEFVTTPIVPSKEQSGAQAGRPVTAEKELCDKLEFQTPMDIDTAYAKAMRAFGFRTTEERKRAAEQNSIGMVDQNFRHTAQPGAMYRMTDYNTVVISERQFRTWASMELWREGPQQTTVKASYCAWRTDGSDETKALLRRAYREAFR